MPIFLTLLLATGSLEPLMDPTPIAARLGFTKLRYPASISEAEAYYPFTRDTDGTNVAVSFSAKPALTEVFVENHSPGGGDTTPLSVYDAGTWSEIPLGSDFRVHYQGPTARAMTLGRFELVNVVMTLPRVPHGRFHKPLYGRDVPDRYREELEYLVRTLLANLVARRLTEPGTVMIGNQSCPTYREMESGKRMISVEGWGRGRGHTFRWNEDTNVIALTKANQTIIVPLGSRKIKVGSQWRDTGEIIALKEGKVFIRLDAVEPG